MISLNAIGKGVDLLLLSGLFCQYSLNQSILRPLRSAPTLRGHLKFEDFFWIVAGIYVDFTPLD